MKFAGVDVEFHGPGPPSTMKFAGVDVGSTTVKAVVIEDGKVRWQDYQRHNTRQAEKVLEFLARMETEAGLTAGADRVFFTGSGAGFIAPQVGAKLIQEVVAVAACVERQHPDVRFVSEIGGEDMKTIFFTATGTGRSKQVYMQSACSGGTGTFIEKTARKLQVPGERLAEIPYAGMSLHKISSKCGIFAETDANTLVKTGVPVEEIIASLFEAVVYQNLATLTKGNTPAPEVLLLGGPNLFFKGLQEAWRHHLAKLWAQRKVDLGGREPASLIVVPAEALYYACLGCVEIGQGEKPEIGVYQGRDKLKWWVEEGQHQAKAKEGARGLLAGAGDPGTVLTASVKPWPTSRRAAGDWRRLPAELAVLVRQRRLPAGRGRALQYPARGLRRPRVRGQGDAEPHDGLRRLPPVGHRQPAAQGLVGRGDHGRAGGGAAGQRVDLRGPAPESQGRRPQVHPARRHPPQQGRGQGAGGLHPEQGSRRRRTSVPVLRRGRRHRLCA